MSNFVSNENATALFTKVKNNFGTQVVEWDVWREMAPQEKEAIPEAKIINAPGIDDNGGHVNVFKKLWENPDPTATFGTQDITLSSDDYDILLWFFRYAKTVQYDLSAISQKGNGTAVTMAGCGGTATYNVYRAAIYNSDTSFTIQACLLQFANQPAAGDNDRLIPTVVYGIKKSIDVTAIISNASTEAKNCYLEDGVTTVGDVIDKGSVTVTGDGVKTYSQLFDSLFALIDYSKVSEHTVLEIVASSTLKLYFTLCVADSGDYMFSRTFVDHSGQGSTIIDTLDLLSSGSTWYRSTIGTTATYANRSANLAGSGQKITLHY